MTLSRNRPRAIIWCAVSSHQQTEDEKFSLPAQEADARALAESKGWDVADVMVVPGHSRRYKDFNDLAAIASRKGIDAFYKLQLHWQRRDFDMLICRDGDRFARSQALFARVVEEVIESAGANIWSLADGLIDKHNYRMWIAMVGYRAASDIDKLVKFRSEGMTRRAQRGLPTTSHVIFSHKLIRDESGKAVQMVVDEAKRRLFDDLATLLFEGVSWGQIERHLFDRFGHANSEGRPFREYYFHEVFHSPTFWGHSARWIDNNGKPNKRRGASWVYDASEAPPDGIMLFRNTHDAVYTGDMVQKVIAELRRRTLSTKGRSRPYASTRYSGLIVCGGCGRYMVYHHKPPVMGCVTNYYTKGACPSKPHRILFPVIDHHLDEWLKTIVQSGTMDAVWSDMPDTNPDQRIALLEREIEQLEAAARRLIVKQMSAPDSLSLLYDEEIASVGSRLNALRAELSQFLTQQKRDVNAERHTIEELRKLTVEGFWSLEEREQNQFLHRLFGRSRLVAMHGEFVGVVDAPRNRGRPPKDKKL